MKFHIFKCGDYVGRTERKLRVNREDRPYILYDKGAYYTFGTIIDLDIPVPKDQWRPGREDQIEDTTCGTVIVQGARVRYRSDYIYGDPFVFLMDADLPIIKEIGRRLTAHRAQYASIDTNRIANTKIYPWVIRYEDGMIFKKTEFEDAVSDPGTTDHNPGPGDPCEAMRSVEDFIINRGSTALLSAIMRIFENMTGIYEGNDRAFEYLAGGKSDLVREVLTNMYRTANPTGAKEFYHSAEYQGHNHSLYMTYGRIIAPLIDGLIIPGFLMSKQFDAFMAMKSGPFEAKINEIEQLLQEFSKENATITKTTRVREGEIATLQDQCQALQRAVEEERQKVSDLEDHLEAEKTKEANHGERLIDSLLKVHAFVRLHRTKNRLDRRYIENGFKKITHVWYGTPAPSSKRIASSDWQECHFSDGSNDSGRLYFIKDREVIHVVLSTKDHQEKDIRWLREHGMQTLQ